MFTPLIVARKTIPAWLPRNTGSADSTRTRSRSAITTSRGREAFSSPVITSSETPMAIWSVVTISPFSALAIIASRFATWARRNAPVERARLASGDSRLPQPAVGMAAIALATRARHSRRRELTNTPRLYFTANALLSRDELDLGPTRPVCSSWIAGVRGARLRCV